MPSASFDSITQPTGVQGTSASCARGKPAGIDDMKAVDILGRIDRVDDLAPIDLLGQRQLHENAVDGRIGLLSLSTSASSSASEVVAGELVLPGVHADFDRLLAPCCAT